MTSLDPAIATVREIAPELDALLAARNTDQSHDTRITALLREWFAAALSEIDWTELPADLPRAHAAGPFRRYVLWRSPQGLTAAIHRWSSDSEPAHDVTIHNHMMSVAGVVLAGTLTHRTFPLAPLKIALGSWLRDATFDPGAPAEASIRAGDAYSLAASDLHWAGVSAGLTITLFITAPRTYRGNVHITPERRVFLKVDGQLAGALREARERGASETQILELLSAVPGSPADSPTAV